MPYYDSARMMRQFHDVHLTQAGQTATWRQFVSASAGVSVAGFDSTPFYREQTITGLFQSLAAQADAPPDGIEIGRVVALTPHPLALRDQLLWQGDTWHVESDSHPLPGAWKTVLRKGI